VGRRAEATGLGRRAGAVLRVGLPGWGLRAGAAGPGLPGWGLCAGGAAGPGGPGPRQRPRRVRSPEVSSVTSVIPSALANRR
jgi:hypothetical protein